MIRIRSLNFKNGAAAIAGSYVEFKDGIAEVKEKVALKTIGIGSYAIVSDHPQPWHKAQRTLFIRGEGVGDVLLCTPILREIRKRVGPNATIDFLTKPSLSPILKHNPDINHIFHYKDMPLDKLPKYNNNINVNMIEFSERHVSARDHRVDVFTQAIEDFPVPLADKSLTYVATQDELNDALERVTRFTGGRPSVCMAITANCTNRILRRQRLIDIANRLVANKINVILLDQKHKNGWEANGVLNLCGELSIREAAAVMYWCDVVLTPDTGLLHLAAALQKETVAYFGAIDWKLRKTHERLHILFHAEECYPCNGYGCDTPYCLRKLSTDTIVSTVIKAMKNVRKM